MAVAMQGPAAARSPSHARWAGGSQVPRGARHKGAVAPAVWVSYHLPKKHHTPGQGALGIAARSVRFYSLGGKSYEEESEIWAVTWGTGGLGFAARASGCTHTCGATQQCIPGRGGSLRIQRSFTMLEQPAGQNDVVKYHFWPIIIVHS